MLPSHPANVLVSDQTGIFSLSYLVLTLLDVFCIVASWGSPTCRSQILHLSANYF